MFTSIAIHGDSIVARRVVAAARRVPGLDLTDSPSADVDLYCDPPCAETAIPGLEDHGSQHTNLALFGPVVRAADRLHRLPSPDACAVQRVLEAVRGLGAMQRCFVRIVTRTSRATEAGLVDALQPTFNDIQTAGELRTLFGGVGTSAEHAEDDGAEFVVRRVVASYTWSHLLVFKLDFTANVDRMAALIALQTAPRILVGSAATDGLPTTAHLQEFFRDQGRPGGERSELFVWEESVLTNGRSLHLMADHSPDSVLLPEILDAVLQLAGGVATETKIGPQTDRYLGLWRDLTGPPA